MSQPNQFSESYPEYLDQLATGTHQLAIEMLLSDDKESKEVARKYLINRVVAANKILEREEIIKIKRKAVEELELAVKELENL